MLKIWIQAARLRTLPLSVSGIITGTALAIKEGLFDGVIFTLAILTTLGFQVLSNFANDYGDGLKGTDNEDRIGPKRVLQSGLLTAQQLKRGMIITVILTLVAALLLIFRAFGTEHITYLVVFFILGIVSIVAAIKYTVGQAAYGYRALGDVFVFVFFGLLAVVGSYFLYSHQLHGWVWFPAISIGLLSTAVLNLNNMRDLQSDQKAHKITLPILLGIRRAKMYHYTLLLLAYASAFVYFYFTATKFYHYLPLLAFLPILQHTKTVMHTQQPQHLDPELKKVAISTFLFAVLFFITLLF
jgi:1,4-dihydroxy-2-naphthoate octaprenyltransferase